MYRTVLRPLYHLALQFSWHGTISSRLPMWLHSSLMHSATSWLHLLLDKDGSSDPRSCFTIDVSTELIMSPTSGTDGAILYFRFWFLFPSVSNSSKCLCPLDGSGFLFRITSGSFCESSSIFPNGSSTRPFKVRVCSCRSSRLSSGQNRARHVVMGTTALPRQPTNTRALHLK